MRRGGDDDERSYMYVGWSVVEGPVSPLMDIFHGILLFVG